MATSLRGWKANYSKGYYTDASYGGNFKMQYMENMKDAGWTSWNCLDSVLIDKLRYFADNFLMKLKKSKRMDTNKLFVKFENQSGKKFKDNYSIANSVNYQMLYGKDIINFYDNSNGFRKKYVVEVYHSSKANEYGASIIVYDNSKVSNRPVYMCNTLDELVVWFNEK